MDFLKVELNQPKYNSSLTVKHVPYVTKDRLLIGNLFIWNYSFTKIEKFCEFW